MKNSTKEKYLDFKVGAKNAFKTGLRYAIFAAVITVPSCMAYRCGEASAVDRIEQQCTSALEDALNSVVGKYER